MLPVLVAGVEGTEASDIDQPGDPRLTDTGGVTESGGQVMSGLSGTGGDVGLCDDARFADMYELHHRSIHDFCRRRLDPHSLPSASAGQGSSTTLMAPLWRSAAVAKASAAASSG